MHSLVLFDMDGVLVDSEPLYRAMNTEFLLSRNYEVTDPEYDKYIGIHAETMWTDLKKKACLKEGVEELVEMERQAKAHLLRTADIQPVRGVLSLLNKLEDAGYLLAVASSSLRSNVDIVLSRLQIDGFFSYSVAGDEVVKGKPDPEIFEKAAAYLGIPAWRCSVVEDSANGILAAKRAEMFAVGYQSPASGNQDLSMADIVVSDLKRLTTAMFPS